MSDSVMITYVLLPQQEQKKMREQHCERTKFLLSINYFRWKGLAKPQKPFITSIYLMTKKLDPHVMEMKLWGISKRNWI